MKIKMNENIRQTIARIILAMFAGLFMIVIIVGFPIILIIAIPFLLLKLFRWALDNYIIND